MALIQKLLLAFITAPLASALDNVRIYGNKLINNRTQGLVTLNGIWYKLSNSTTDVSVMDPMRQPEACTRDAALMQRIGINTIYVDIIDPTKNHDDCFSIFNSVGIYVVVWLRYTATSYTTQDMQDIFQMIDAVKDYENLLAFDVGLFPTNADSDLADSQKGYRAMIRDTKEYVTKNAGPILVGGTVISTANFTWEQVTFLSCIINGDQNDTSRADYVGFRDVMSYDKDVAQNRNHSWGRLINDAQQVSVPTWLSQYVGRLKTGSEAFNVTPETLDEISMLYDNKNDFLQPYGPLNGGAWFQWANVAAGGNSTSAGSVVLIDSLGNLQLTPNFDKFLSIFEQLDTSYFRSGEYVPLQGSLTYTTCTSNLLATPTYSSNSTTFSIATDWNLPTKPPELDAIISKGAGGRRGSMVDVYVTTVQQTVRDSRGSVVTGLVITPTIIRSGAASVIAPPSGPSLTSGQMAGIGIGGGIAGLGIAGGLVFWFLRVRKRKSTPLGKDEETKNTDLDGYVKPELSTGPETNVKPKAELPGNSLDPEVHGNTQANAELSGDAELSSELLGDVRSLAELLGNAPPVELPANERPQELGGDINLNEANKGQTVS